LYYTLYGWYFVFKVDFSDKKLQLKLWKKVETVHSRSHINLETEERNYVASQRKFWHWKMFPNLLKKHVVHGTRQGAVYWSQVFGLPETCIKFQFTLKLRWKLDKCGKSGILCSNKIRTKFPN
jgi:hypothetical protein